MHSLVVLVVVVLVVQFHGPKWPKKHSPGFTLGNSPPEFGPEGAIRYGENWLVLVVVVMVVLGLLVGKAIEDDGDHDDEDEHTIRFDR